MIGSYLIRNEYQLVKLIKDRKQVVPVSHALDNKYVIPESIDDGTLQNHSRCRPFYTMPYSDMYCENAPNCSTDCMPCYHKSSSEDYWDGFDIGFACGAPNGIVVIDNDTGMDLKTFSEHVRRFYGPLPDTWISETRSGGHHFYYSYQGELKSNISNFIPKVDIISTNRWVVLPPCNGYTWLIPPTAPPAPLPSWVMNLRVNQLQTPTQQNRSYQPLQPKDDRNLVLQALSRMRIENIDGQTWAKIGYALCSNGYEQEFRDWCHTDTRKGKMFKEAQIRAFRTPDTITSLGVFFKIAKENG